MHTSNRGYESVSRSHQIIADLQAIHRNQKAEEAAAAKTGTRPSRSERSMDLELQASAHGASGEAIRSAAMTRNIYARLPGRINAVSGFYADLAASRARVLHTSQAL